MIAAVPSSAATHCCDGEELRVPGSPQPYASRVRGSWRDYLQDPLDNDDDDDGVDGDDSYGEDDESYGDVCSCCSLCSSGGGGCCGRNTPPASSLSRSSSSSSSTSSSSSIAAPANRRCAASPVFEPSMRGSCLCISCQKRRYSLDFFKSTDFRRGIPSPNVYMIDKKSCKIVDDYIYDRNLQIGHRPANVVKDKKLNFITWEPYFCVLLQDEQTLTAYRSEELSIFPGTALRTITHAFKFSQRFQRSLGLPYPYGSHYVYNPPIEPTLDNLDHVPDSRIDSYKPTYWPFRKSHPISHDIVPKSLPYRSIKSMQVPNTYDSEFYDTLDLPSLTSENNYNKYHAILNGYRKQQLSTMAEPNLAIQLLATTNIFHGYEVPTYQYPNNDESIVSNIVNKVPNTVFDRESQTYEMIPEVSKESPTVILLALSPETPEIQKNTNVAIEEKSPIFEITENESDITTTKTSLLNEEIKEILTLIEKLNATEVEETSNEDETLKTTVTTEKKLSENKLNVVPSLTSIVVSMYKNNAEEEKNTLDEEPQLTPIVEQRSPEMTLVENSAENEQNVLDKEPELTPLVELRSPEMVLIENLAEDEQNTQDEEPQLTPIVEQRSHEIELIENSTEEEQNTQSKEPQLTPIENQSLSEIVIVDNSTEKELMSTPENSITTTEDTSDINKSTFKLAEKQQIKIKDILQQYKELKPLFLTVDNISAEFPSNLSANKIEVEQAIAMYDENNEEER